MDAEHVGMRARWFNLTLVKGDEGVEAIKESADLPLFFRALGNRECDFRYLVLINLFRKGNLQCSPKKFLLSSFRLQALNEKIWVNSRWLKEGKTYIERDVVIGFNNVSGKSHALKQSRDPLGRRQP